MIDPKDVLLGDRIVGIDQTTLDDHGPGAIGVEPMAAPPELTPWVISDCHPVRGELKTNRTYGLSVSGVLFLEVPSLG